MNDNICSSRWCNMEDKVHEVLMHGHQTRINHDNIKSVDGFWAGNGIKKIEMFQ